MDLADILIKKGVLKNPGLIEAFRIVDRKWFVPDGMESEAYEDYPSPIGEGQTISQPWTVAFMLELLCGSSDVPTRSVGGRSPDECVGKNIMEIGYGSGWVTALLAACGANVWAIEKIPNLCEFGKQNIQSLVLNKKSLGGSAAKWGKIEFFCQDGASGLPEVAKEIGGFDKIIASAALQLWTSDLPAGEAGVHSLPQAWRDQLKIGGKIVAPIGGSIFEFVKKSETEFSSTEHPGFAFVPLIRDK